MSTTQSRAAVNELLIMFDHVLEEHGFGWDHWHSLLWNLHNVAPDEWTRLPPGGGRTIRELVVHMGSTFLMYASHSFGDRSREWGDRDINGLGPGDSPEQTEAWLRRAHAKLRERIADLTDDQLRELRPAPWGDEYEIRRLIELQIQHTLYHTGEINHIRALLQGNDDWDHQDMGRE
ncbi:MAG: DinB family protein [Thermomicrobiales bacterium]